MSISITEDVRVEDTPRPANNKKGTTMLTPEELAKREKNRNKKALVTHDKGPDDEKEEDDGED